MTSTVFTIGLRAKSGKDSHQAKIEKLARAIGIDKFDWKQKLAAIKLHFGERGNSAFLRPTLVRPLVTIVRTGGGKPFLAETNTLYTGSRSNAPDHIETALLHGFGFEVTGAPIVICDGITGRNSSLVPIEGKHFDKIAVASEIFEADALIVLSHFKGHEVTGFGGAIKNLGMGCCSRSAKLAMHASIRPSISTEKCVKCGNCLSWCSTGALRQASTNGPISIDRQVCIGCGECLIACRLGAIKINWSEDTSNVTERMVEHALGVMKTKKNKAFFLNVVMDVVPCCDCYGFSDAPVVPNVGFAASCDPVALDAACIDWVNEQPGLSNTALKGGFNSKEEKLSHVHESLDCTIQLKYGCKIGLGNDRYERVNLD